MTVPEWIVKYWVEWLFGIVAAVLGVLYKHLSTKVQQTRLENAAIRDGLRSLLRRQIIADCEESIAEGFCPTTKKDTIQDMYSSYHALGGNGTVTKLVEQLMDLPTVEEGKQ